MDSQELTTVVDMGEHFDVDAQMEELSRKRFSMPPAVIAAFRQAAMKGAARLLNLVEDDAQFSKLRVQDQLRVLELIFDRAYGKTETASSHAVAEVKTSPVRRSGHSDQLDAIAARAAARGNSRNSRAVEDHTASPASPLASPESAALGSAQIFPELRRRNANGGENVVRMPRRPL